MLPKCLRVQWLLKIKRKKNDVIGQVETWRCHVLSVDRLLGRSYLLLMPSLVKWYKSSQANLFMNDRVYIEPSLTNTISAALLLCIKYSHVKQPINQSFQYTWHNCQIVNIFKNIPFLYVFPPFHFKLGILWVRCMTADSHFQSLCMVKYSSAHRKMNSKYGL